MSLYDDVQNLKRNEKDSSSSPVESTSRNTKDPNNSLVDDAEDEDEEEDDKDEDDVTDVIAETHVPPSSSHQKPGGNIERSSHRHAVRELIMMTAAPPSFFCKMKRDQFVNDKRCLQLWWVAVPSDWQVHFRLLVCLYSTQCTTNRHPSNKSWCGTNYQDKLCQLLIVSSVIKKSQQEARRSDAQGHKKCIQSRMRQPPSLRVPQSRDLAGW